MAGRVRGPGAYLMLLESGNGVDDSLCTSPEFAVVMGQRSASHLAVLFLEQGCQLFQVLDDSKRGKRRMRVRG